MKGKVEQRETQRAYAHARSNRLRTNVTRCAEQAVPYALRECREQSCPAPYALSLSRPALNNIGNG